METSIRTARIGVYKLLDIPKQVPDISPTQYDIRNLIKGARALNSGKPFTGERLLHRVLDKTYFAHILPPLPEADSKKQTHFEEELNALLGKGNIVIHKFTNWVGSIRDNFLHKEDK